MLDPVYSTTIFLDRLLEVPNWERLPVTVAAYIVQRSAFPDAYAEWEGLAARSAVAGWSARHGRAGHAQGALYRPAPVAPRSTVCKGLRHCVLS